MTTGPPTEDRRDDGLEVGRPATAAAGLTGVVEGLRHARDQLGVRRGARVLLRVNQPDGFDCPGCAWPEPPAASAPGSSSARTGRRRSPRRRPSGGSDRRSSPRTRSSDLAGTVGPLAGPAGPAHRSRCTARPATTTTDPIALGRRLRAAWPRSSRGLALPDRAVFYTSGRTSNEAAFLYQLFVRSFGTNNLPDCSNMCHESSGVALTETIGVGKGTRHPRRHPPRPTSSSSSARTRAPTTRACSPRSRRPRRTGATHRRRQPAARGRADPVQEPADGPGPRRPRDRPGRPVPPGAGRRRPAAVPAAQPAGWSTPAASTRTSSTDHCDGLRRAGRPPPQASTPTSSLAATGLARARRARGCATLVPASRAHDRVLGDGPHPAPAGGGDDPGDRQPRSCCAGSIGEPGAGALPGARAQQRPGRPHDGHLREAGGRVPRPPRRRVRLRRRRASPATTPSTPSGPCARRGRRVRRHGRQLRRRRARHRRDGRGPAPAAGSPCRSSTKLNRSPRHRRRGGAASCRASAAPSDDVTGGPGPVRHRRGLDEHGARLARLARPAVARAAQRGGHRVRLARARARPERQRRRLGRPRARTTTSSATTSRRSCPGFERFNERVRQPGGFALPAPAARQPHLPDRERHAPSSRSTRSSRSRCRPAGCCSRPSARTTSTTRRSTGSTTATAASARAGGSCSCNPADLAEPRPGRRRRWSTSSASGTTGSSAGPPASASVAYPIAAGTCAAYFPEANVLVPLDSVAEASNTPTSKSVVIRLERSTPGR